MVQDIQTGACLKKMWFWDEKEILEFKYKQYSSCNLHFDTNSNNNLIRNII